MLLTSAFLMIAIGWAGEDLLPLPQVDEIVAKMTDHDRQRRAEFHGYIATRRYVLENSRHHKRAEMLVSVKVLDDGSKQFETVSESGWHAARSHVFPKLLDGEREASQPGRERPNITPENYSFAMVGQDTIDQRAAYILAITPKARNKYLIEGRIWVDADDYGIVRVEGKPAKSPSFWIKSVHLVRTYRKTGCQWLPVSDHSVTDARVIGSTDLTIEHFDYSANNAAMGSLR